MRPMNNRAALTALLALAGIVTLSLTLDACGHQPSLGDYRPVVDSYNTNIAAYEADGGQCVASASWLLSTSTQLQTRARSSTAA